MSLWIEFLRSRNLLYRSEEFNRLVCLSNFDLSSEVW